MMTLLVIALWIALNLSQGLGSQGTDPDLDVTDPHVIGVLGDEVYLRCLYTGKNLPVISSFWKRSSFRKKLSGYRYGGEPFAHDHFSSPASLNNLTVKVKISDLNMEGQYECVFDSDDEERKEVVNLTVLARPDIRTNVEEEILHETLYQTVSCSASNAKPMALINWEIHGSPPSRDIFNITSTNIKHENHTSSITSTLRFPVFLNTEDSVFCVVQHPALTEPRKTHIELQTFISPTITMETGLMQEEGKEFFEISCRAEGGMPPLDITWILPGPADAPYFQKDEKALNSTSSSRRFPSDLHEGENVTCVFANKLLTEIDRRTVTLPTYYLTSFQLTNRSEEFLTLEEGDTDIIISMAVEGNTPTYKINCTKDDDDLPEDVDVVGGNFWIKGPVAFDLVGQYKCQASYYRHTAFLKFQIKVNPKALEPATFPPNISVNSWKEDNNIRIECLASNANPAANVSWDLPQNINGSIESDINSSNGSHSVRSILTLSSCLPQELTVECVVEHPELAVQERRAVFLPDCVASNITLQSSTMWENGTAIMEVNCSADITTPDATLAWVTEACRHEINQTKSHTVLNEPEGFPVRIWSRIHLAVHTYTGCNVTCVLENHGLERPERKSIHIPYIGANTIHVRAGPQKDSKLWVAICEYEGDGVIPNMSWVTSDHNTTAVPTSIHLANDSIKVLVKSTYQFPLSLLEGKSLTCLIRSKYGADERRTIHVPKYFISSIVVFNKPAPLHGNHLESRVHRVVLQENLPNQRIVFKVHGNTPDYNIKCFRDDGTPAVIASNALFFNEPVSEQDAGLYTCNAFWYNHNATVSIQVEVESIENLGMTFILICFSSATAITLFLTVVLCVFCSNRNGKKHPSKKDRKKHESLADLMQDPRSPELKKAAVSGAKAQEYAELVRYSIVLDQKSTV